MWLLLLTTFLLRIFLSFFGTLENDFGTFLAWSYYVEENGFSKFYDQWSDYLPGYIYVLWFLKKLSLLLPQVPLVLLYKLPAILADIGVGLFIYKAVSKFNKRWALPATAVYLFNPAVFANSALWGQIDGITSLFGVSSIFFATSFPLASSISLSLGTLIKPQAGFLAPLLFLLWCRNFGFRKALGSVIVALAIFFEGFVLFAGEKQIIPFIVERLGATAGQYPYTSVNAFNFWGLVHGFWKPDVDWQIVGALITVLTLGALIFYFFAAKRKDMAQKFLLASCVFLFSFLFLTRMHERHLLPTLAPLVIAAVSYPLLWAAFAALSVTYLVNLRWAGWLGVDFQEILPRELIAIFIVVNLVSAGLMVLVLLKPKIGRLSSAVFKFTNGRTVENSFVKNHAQVLLILVIFFAFISRVIGLNFPPVFYFDEVYHAFTAREMLLGNPAAWEWWNTPPEGFAYEWTHPPLAKLFMAASMAFLGENSFAWRLPGAVLGTGVVFLIYLLGKQLFKKESVGILAAAVFTLDGLPLVMSRIGMNDTYFLFFTLFSIWLFLKSRFFLSALSLGLAFSAKWAGIWIIPVLFLIMFLFKTKPRFNIFLFLVLPPAVYLLSYSGFFLSGHNFAQFIELQKQMWWYHTGLTATHPYQSSWWSWPLLLRPIWLFVQDKGAFVSNIYAMGNPFVFWGGLVALGVIGVMGVIKRQKKLLFVFAAWGLFFLPWALSPRIMFLYHYLPALPFLSLALGWFLSLQNKKLVTCYLLLVTVVYLFFFPHWTGIFVPKWLDELYYWLPGWR